MCVESGRAPTDSGVSGAVFSRTSYRMVYMCSNAHAQYCLHIIYAYTTKLPSFLNEMFDFVIIV